MKKLIYGFLLVFILVFCRTNIKSDKEVYISFDDVYSSFLLLEESNSIYNSKLLFF